jgi:serine protease Do
MRHLQWAEGGVVDGAPARALRHVLAAAFTSAFLIATVAGAQAKPAPDSFADLAAKVSPAVVNISSSHRVPGGEALPELPFNIPKGSPFEEFFKRFRDMERGEGRRPPREATALGSGFIIDPSGYVVTNNHVVEDATEVQVTLTTGEQFDGKIIGRDPKTDLALLKIESERPLPALEWGDSDALRVGDWVMAVGNPFGLGGSVTAGIVSARGRDINAGPFDDFLQIDASINQGNSGGPTFDLDGKVVGINTAIASPNGGSVGIGFAIPSNLARPIIAQLREHGSVERGWLGVQIQTVTPDLASALGLDRPKGALVAVVQPDSPAEKAQLKAGDVILRFDGKAVDEMRDLPRLVAAVPAGREVEVVVWRDKTEKSIEVEIAKLQEEQQVAAASPAEPEKGDTTTHASRLLGLTLAAITPELKRQYGLGDAVQGVLVVDVDEDGPAADQGIRAGDVIEKVAHAAVSSPADVDKLANEAREANQKALLLLLNRDGNTLFVAVKMNQA